MIVDSALTPTTHSQKTGTVRVGDLVRLALLDGGEAVVRVVSPGSTAMPDGETSTDAPLGAALLGSGVGDACMVVAPAGAYSIEVLAINAALGSGVRVIAELGEK